MIRHRSTPPTFPYAVDPAAYGCTHDQWRQLCDVRDKMLAQGKGQERTPVQAFTKQKYRAARRGIGWELTLWQWWTIWQESGHWEQRGRGNGYVMCRKGDEGPYAAGNVFIGTAVQNSYEGQVKHYNLPGDLPIGVRRTVHGRYVAVRHSRHIGTFGTPEEAHAAYLLDPPDKPRLKRRKSDFPSGVRLVGVRFHACFYVNGKYVHVGSFGTVDEAVSARAAAMAQLARAA